MPLAFFETSFVSFPVHSSAYFSESTVEPGLVPKRYWPWLTHRIRFDAVLAGSKVKPVSSRLPPLAVCSVVMIVGAPSVPSLLIE